MTLGLRQIFFYYKSDYAVRNVFSTKQYICIKYNECTWSIKYNECTFLLSGSKFTRTKNRRGMGKKKLWHRWLRFTSFININRIWEQHRPVVPTLDSSVANWNHLGSCDNPNVCIPSKFICWSSISQMWWYSELSLCKVIRVRWSPMAGPS